MNFSKRNKSIVDFIFVFALLGAFAVSAMFVVLFGAKVFRNTTNDMESNYNKRTACLYVEEKIRTFDMSGCVKVSYNNGDSVVMFSTFANDKEYITYMYLDGGYLKESTIPKEMELKYDEGQEIVELSAFEASIVNDNLIHFHIVDANGNTSDFYKNVQSGVEGGDNETF